MNDPESRHEPGDEFSDAAETVLHPIEVGDSGPITDPEPEEAAQEMVIEVIGPYDVLEEIARGGMGVVYRARHRELGRTAALKLIRSGVGAGEEERRRFHIEASALARLEHPHIVPLYEAGEHASQPFLAMAFIDGAPLSARLQQGPMRPTEAVGMLHQVAEAIEAAHVQGIVHRDLKPANILIDSRGQPRVTDFGLAKQEQTPESLTLSGQILGTPGYMPPEQAEGDLSAVGPRSDVYALGAVLYAMLTGRPPFQSATPLDTLRQVIEHDPPSARTLNPQVPEDVDLIIMTCLRKNPDHRYQSAAELAADLERWLNGAPILARSPSLRSRITRFAARHRSAGIVLLAVLLSVALTAAVVQNTSGKAALLPMLLGQAVLVPLTLWVAIGGAIWLLTRSGRVEKAELASENLLEDVETLVTRVLPLTRSDPETRAVLIREATRVYRRCQRRKEFTHRAAGLAALAEERLDEFCELPAGQLAMPDDEVETTSEIEDTAQPAPVRKSGFPRRLRSRQRWLAAFGGLMLVTMAATLFVSLTMSSRDRGSAFLLLVTICGPAVFLTLLLGPAPVFVLKRQLRAPQRDVRLEAIAALQKQGAKARRALDAVYERMRSDPSREVRRAAAEAVAVIGVEDAAAGDKLREAATTTGDPDLARLALRGSQQSRAVIDSKRSLRFDWALFGCWLRTLWGESNELTRRQSRALLLNGLKAFVGSLIAISVVYLLDRQQLAEHRLATRPLFVWTTLGAALFLTLGYPFSVVFSRRGGFLYQNPDQRLFGLSERGTMLFFGLFVLFFGCAVFSREGDLRSMGLAAFGTILVWEGCFPAIRVDPR